VATAAGDIGDIGVIIGGAIATPPAAATGVPRAATPLYGMPNSVAAGSAAAAADCGIPGDTAARGWWWWSARRSSATLRRTMAALRNILTVTYV